MVKSKAAKKPPSQLKISTTSLFKRNSKNSTGQVDKESASTSAGKSGKGTGKVAKRKGTAAAKGKFSSKGGSKQSSSTGSSASSSPTSSSSSNAAATVAKNKKQQYKKAPATSTAKKSSQEVKATTLGKKKAATATTKKGVKAPTPVKGKPSKSDTTSKSKTAARSKVKSSGSRKDKDKSPSPKSRRSRRSSSTSSETSNTSSSSHSSTSSSNTNTEESSSSADDRRGKGGNNKKKANPKKTTKKATPVSTKITRKRSKSDADTEASLPSSPLQHKMARRNTADEEGEINSGGNSKKKGVSGAANAKNNKTIGKANKTPSTVKTNATAVAKKVTKRAAASVVASKKKKPPVKPEKVSPSSATKGKAKSQADKSKSVLENKMNKKNSTTASTTKGSKAKAKPRPKPKLKRMASLNAKAILEASFSFEPQEKKQRSPAPSSSSVMSKLKNTNDAATSPSTGKHSASSGEGYTSNEKPIIGSSSSSTTQKGNDDVMSISVSTSTSPPPSTVQSLLPPPSSSSTQSPGKVVGERKRKSSEISSRRESTASIKSNSSSKTASNKVDAASGISHVISMGTSTTNTTSESGNKAVSRRNSATTMTTTGTSTESTSIGGGSASKMIKKSRKESPSPKKKTKVSTATTSTSTSTSPLPCPDFYPDQPKQQQPTKPKEKHKHKKEKLKGVDSGTNTLAGDQYHKDSGIQGEHDIYKSQASVKQKSSGCQAKERKSSTPVAHFGTVYQPAGPLIEPHKTSSSIGSVPMGLLPETVKLPPDLKVTYQTHPPTSNPSSTAVSHSSSSKASKKHASSLSSSTSTSSHHHHHQSQKSSSSSLEKSSGQILHQPYKSSLSSSSSLGTGTQSSSLPRPIQATYPGGVSYVSAATGSPLLSSSSSILSQQSAAVVQQQQQHHHHQQQLASAGLSMTGHHHSLSSTGSSVGVGIGSSQQPPPPSASAGAPSAGGLFYSSSAGFAPHHSPFAPCKYPMVPPDSYRTHSPYQNSILYPPSTPQQSPQSYYMTPLYTPPLTPNSTPAAATVGSGLGNVNFGASQPRPLSLAAHHHPSVAAASFYQPHSGLLPPSAHHHPSNYLVASPHPHHSIQPVPTAPGHAGLFHLNQSTQPACPCPTESCPLSSTNSNRPLQQSASSVLRLVPEVGAEQPHPQSQQALVCTTAARPSRNFNSKEVPHPPTCITPAVAADPPVTIQLLNSNIDVQKSQARQLESAKTFTTTKEQYSLPDDITITPIIINNSNANALILMNTSISIVSTSAPTSTSYTNSPLSNVSSKIPTNQSVTGKKKEKDIVHVIDPRSGQKTTIAKHISNKNLLANSINKNCNLSAPVTSPNKNPGQSVGGIAGSPVSRLKPNTNKIGAVRVGKLNPDLDVIVINSTGSNRVVDDSITENVKLIQEQHQQSQLGKGNKSAIDLQSSRMVTSTNKNPGKKSANQLNVNVNTKAKGNKGQIASRRIALADNDNNSPRKIAPIKKTDKPSVPFQPGNNSAFNYSLPPGISISPGVGTNLSISTTNLNNISSIQNNVNVRPVAVDNAQKSDNTQANLPTSDHHSQLMIPNQNGSNCSEANRKRISLNKCIDGLQKKRQKLFEDHHGVLLNGVSPINGNSPLAPKNGKGPNPPMVYQYSEAVKEQAKLTSARVRDLSNVIKSSDAVAAVSAVVLDPDTYHLTRNARGVSGYFSAVKELHKNGLKKGKFQQPKKKCMQTSLPSITGKKRSSSKYTNIPNPNGKGKLKPSEKANSLNTRNTRSAAANAKIRTRLSTKPKTPSYNSNSPSDPSLLNSRSRSRLLRKRNQIINSDSRKSESDCSSTCTSRSSSAARIATGSSGKVEKDRVSASTKYPNQRYINAVADLYQYRRNVMLRVPRAGAGILPSASSVSSLNLPGTSSSAISNVGFVAKASSSSVPQGKSKIQLSPGNQNSLLEYKTPFGGSSSRSSSPGLPGAVGKKNTVGSFAASAAKKRAGVKPLSPTSINRALIQLGVARRPIEHGWRFEGNPYDSKVLINNDDQPVFRRCYPAIRHESGDVIQTRDCVLVKSGKKPTDLPYIAKVAALWENPSDGNMNFSLLWYYRPEHTAPVRTKENMSDLSTKDYMPDEIFASKHVDTSSVATIEDRCYVLTFNEYCRYRKKLKQLEEGLPDKPLLSQKGSSMINNNAAGNIAAAVWNGRSTADPNRAPSPKISPEVVFFCRKVYDFRQSRIMKNPS